MKLLITELQGEGYELGKKFAALFPRHHGEYFEEYRQALSLAPVREKVKATAELLQSIYPEQAAEMMGRAEGFSLSYEEYLLCVCCQSFSLSSMSRHESCSDILVKTPSGILAGHNEDILENLDELALIKYINRDGSWYTDMSTCNCPQGGTFGYNSHGISWSVNAIDMPELCEGGLPEWFILKDIVNCSSAAEIVGRIKAVPCAGAFNLNVTEFKTGKAYSIERCYSELSLTEVEDIYCHTNHLIHPDIKYKSAEITESTRERLAVCMNLTREKRPESTEDIKAILMRNKSKDDYVLRAIGHGKYATAATFLVDSAHERVEIVSHYDKEIYKFSLK